MNNHEAGGEREEGGEGYGDTLFVSRGYLVVSRVNGNNNRRFISGLRLPIFYSRNLAISIQWNEACIVFQV